MSVPAPLTDVAADWIRCDSCHEYVYRRRFVRALHVCPGCGHHGRLSAHERIALLLDDVGHEEMAPAVVVQDPLEFTDTRPYRERMAQARAHTGLDEAIVVVRGHLDGHRVVVAAMDFGFIGGSLGVGVGEQLARAADWALDTRSPLVIVCASGGARMQEGALSLMQMATTAQALSRLDDAGVLTVSLVTDPTYGGVAASFATLCDVVIAEPRARMGFAGPRVIEQTINQTLPDGFQTAEFLREHGLIDDVVERSSLRGFLSDLLAITRSGALGLADGVPDGADPHDDVAAPSAWDAVQRARHIDRPTALDYARRILVGFHELHGDRAGADCPAVVGGFGRLGGRPVLLVGHQKGHSTRELVARSFGMPSPAGFRKAGRLMRLAQKLNVPVVTLIDTPGAHPGLAAEENGQAVAIAESIRTMAGLTVPVVSVVTGEGGSGGALALGVANRVLSLANGVYSVISPEGCASILWKDPAAAPDAAEALRIDAAALMRLSVIDRVVPEPGGGAHLDPDGTARALAVALMTALAELGGLGPDELIDQRRDRFRRISGAPDGGSR